MDSPDKLVIIPAFNEASQIAAVVAGIRAHCDADIVVIDDGSQDETAREAVRAGALVVRHPFNMGYGVALQTGYKYAAARNYTHLVQMDGDNQHDPCYLPQLFAEIEKRCCDVLIGSRFLENNHYDTGVWKGLAVLLFRWIIRRLGKADITDPTSGFQCLTRRVYTLFTHDSFPWDYPDANIIIMLLRLGFKVQEIPVAMASNRKRPGMHQGFFKIANYFFKVFLSIFIALIRDKSEYPLKETYP